MQRMEDVQNLLAVLREYEIFGHWLPADLAQMTVRTIESLLKERDAAVEDIRTLGRMGENTCAVCKNRNRGEGGEKCIGCLIEDNWEWRGVQEGNHAEEKRG